MILLILLISLLSSSFNRSNASSHLIIVGRASWTKHGTGDKPEECAIDSSKKGSTSNKYSSDIGVQCCKSDGTGYRKKIPGGDSKNNGCLQAVDYQTALSACKTNGDSLCTAEQVRNNVGAGKGCNHDARHVWTSTVCVESKSKSKSKSNINGMMMIHQYNKDHQQQMDLINRMKNDVSNEMNQMKHINKIKNLNNLHQNKIKTLHQKHLTDLDKKKDEIRNEIEMKLRNEFEERQQQQNQQQDMLNKINELKEKQNTLEFKHKLYEQEKERKRKEMEERTKELESKLKQRDQLRKDNQRQRTERLNKLTEKTLKKHEKITKKHEKLIKGIKNFITKWTTLKTPQQEQQLPPARNKVPSRFLYKYNLPLSI